MPITDLQVQQQPLPEDAENIGSFWDRAEHVYEDAVRLMDMGNTVCLVSHAAVHAALLCRCLGLAIEDMGKFRMSTAGVTVIEFPYEEGTGIVRCDSYFCGWLLLDGLCLCEVGGRDQCSTARCP